MVSFYSVDIVSCTMVSFYSSDIVSYTMVSSCFLDIGSCAMISLRYQTFSKDEFKYHSSFTSLETLHRHVNHLEGYVGSSPSASLSQFVIVLVVMVAVVEVPWSGNAHFDDQDDPMKDEGQDLKSVNPSHNKYTTLFVCLQRSTTAREKEEDSSLFIIALLISKLEAYEEISLKGLISFQGSGLEVRSHLDVYEGEITLRVGKEAITFNLDQTSKYTADYNHMTVNKIDVIDMACDEYSQEVLGFSNVIASGNPTPYFEPIVSTASPNLTPFGDSDFLLFEEADSVRKIL
ncbi:hypothetical protein Tco_0339101 [Tanacetum coccineum]